MSDRNNKFKKNSTEFNGIFVARQWKKNNREPFEVLKSLRMLVKPSELRQSELGTIVLSLGLLDMRGRRRPVGVS